MSKLVQTCDALGLHPFVGFGMAAVDVMLFGAPGVGWVVSVPVALALTVPCILIQRYGFKESWGLAIGKGMMVGVLTAIPTPLPAALSFTGGAMGTVALISGDRALPESSQG